MKEVWLWFLWCARVSMNDDGKGMDLFQGGDLVDYLDDTVSEANTF